MMDSTREELPDVNDYARSLSEVVAEYAGGNLTTIVCMTCGENFTRYLPGVNGITECGGAPECGSGHIDMVVASMFL